MCNCGNKRAQISGQYAHTAKEPSNSEALKNIRADVFFEYTGHSRLAITGPQSGKRYQFSHTGAIQPIDYRDALYMTGVPVLRKTKGTK